MTRPRSSPPTALDETGGLVGVLYGIAVEPLVGPGHDEYWGRKKE